MNLFKQLVPNLGALAAKEEALRQESIVRTMSKALQTKQIEIHKACDVTPWDDLWSKC